MAALLVLGLAHAYWHGLHLADINASGIVESLLIGELQSAAVLVGATAIAVVALLVLAKSQALEMLRDCSPTLVAMSVLLLSLGTSIAAVAIPQSTALREAESTPALFVILGLVIVSLLALAAFLAGLVLALRHRLRAAESARGLLPLIVAISALYALGRCAVHVMSGDFAAGYPPLVGVLLAFGGPLSVLFLAWRDIRYVNATGGIGTPRFRLPRAA